MKLVNPLNREATQTIRSGANACGCYTFASQSAMLGGNIWLAAK